MPTANLLPMPKAVFFDQRGNPLSGGFVYTQVPGGGPPKTVWQDAAETIPLPYPVTLDADGATFLYGSGDYFIQTTDALGNQVSAFTGPITSGRPSSDFLIVTDFGAKGDGITNDTDAINAASAAGASMGKTVFFPAGTYMVSDGGAGTGVYCLLNTGASWLGEGRDTTVIVPTAATSLAADILKIKPPPGNEDFLSFQHFMINPGGSGAPRGKRAIYLDATASTSVTELHIADVYCTPGNDYSLYMDNNAAVNAQGVPANSVVERCYFADGTKWVSTGDSVTMRNCVLRGTPGSARSGVLALIQTGTGGTSSHFIIEQCNFDCAGAAIWILNGRNTKILYNNIESSYGTGSSSAAVIDIDGTSGAVVMPEIKGNAVSIFGTSSAATAIRVNAAVECDIDNNTIIAGFAVPQAIAITANAQHTCIGLNEFSATYVTSINNSGIGTRGVRIPLIPINGFTNVGLGSVVAGYWQTKQGVVILEGMLNCPPTPNGLTICLLSDSSIPPDNRRFAVYALLPAGVIGPQSVEVQAGGSVLYFGDTTAVQVSLDGITYATNSGIVGTL